MLLSVECIVSGVLSVEYVVLDEETHSNARTQPSFDQTDDGVDAETSLYLSLHLYLSSQLLHFLLTLTFGL